MACTAADVKGTQRLSVGESSCRGEGQSSDVDYELCGLGYAESNVQCSRICKCVDVLILLHECRDAVHPKKHLQALQCTT